MTPTKFEHTISQEAIVRRHTPYTARSLGPAIVLCNKQNSVVFEQILI